ncbi:MAG: AMP-binding protein [Acidimicrobiales bacterium]|jgi:long-chain acyl-CoA synthetase|nr:AMP-binding protein [Acidimicrobiales bacterium]HJM97133.1 AMP-binding protein [Acidimicrobiales bacterium]
MPKFAEEQSNRTPDAIALTDPQKSLTWEQVDEILNRAANIILKSDLGSKRRIAVFAENASETALAHLGALFGGASSVPVNFHLTAEEASYILKDSESQILFLDDKTADRGILAAQEAGVELIIGWNCEAYTQIINWEEWLATGSPDPSPDEVTPLPNLLYTSGTTGLPKGTELPPTMFAGGSTMTEHIKGLSKSGFAEFGTHLVVGPMYHTGPLSGMRLLTLGIPSVILGRFDAESTLAAIQQHGTESAVMVPTHFVRMLALPEETKKKYDISSMKFAAHTGAKCPVDVMRAMIEWWGPVFRDAYGASEVGTVCAITSEEWINHPGSVGRSIPPFAAFVLDNDLNELPPNTEGRLFFRDSTGRGIVYPNDAEKTASANPEPGLFTLGEIGYMNKDGYVFITDRFSDMVVSGGVNLYPAEAEQLLIDHPEVADVGCIGVPNDDLGEELKALIISNDSESHPNTEEISNWLKDRLSHYKCPRSYEIVSTLNRNTMGKINKRKLRDSYLNGDLT